MVDQGETPAGISKQEEIRSLGLEFRDDGFCVIEAHGVQGFPESKSSIVVIHTVEIKVYYNY